MSDSNKPKPLPPDDFSATTPNIKLPQRDSGSGQSAPSDWEKTNYNYSPKDLQPKEDWNKTAYNIPKSTPPKQDFDKTNFSAKSSPKDADWGMTQANINLPGNQSSTYNTSSFDDYSDNRRSESSSSSSRTSSPQYQEPKYQEPPKNEVVEEKKDGGKKGGSGWLWASAGLLGMFLFAILVLVGVYFFFLGKTGFEVAVQNVPSGSDLYINGAAWGYSESDGTTVLKTLRAGQEGVIEIKNPGWKCEPIKIAMADAKDGAVLKPTARCENTGKTPPNEPTKQEASKECLEIKAGDFQTSRQCANTELDKLEKKGNWTVDELLYAMNLYIVNFAKGDDKIRNEDMPFMVRASGFIKKLPPNTVIEVGGHTDTDGTDATNQPLSERRANSVRNGLVNLGVSPNMLKTQGYGSKRPKPGNTNSTDDEKFRNRRIEYTVLSK